MQATSMPLFASPWEANGPILNFGGANGSHHSTSLSSCQDIFFSPKIAPIVELSSIDLNPLSSFHLFFLQTHPHFRTHCIPFASSTRNTHPSAGSDFHKLHQSRSPHPQGAGRFISSHLKQHTTLAHTICRLRHHKLQHSIQRTLKTRRSPLPHSIQAELPHK
jgi:hypothetical protein